MTPASELTIGIVLPDDTLGVLYYPGVAGEGGEERWAGTLSDEESVRTMEQGLRETRRA